MMGRSRGRRTGKTPPESLDAIAEWGWVFVVKCGKCSRSLDRWTLTDPEHATAVAEGYRVGVVFLEAPPNIRTRPVAQPIVRSTPADVALREREPLAVIDGEEFREELGLSRWEFRCRRRCGARYRLKADTILGYIVAAAEDGRKEIVLGVDRSG